jgi:hypothetical protein
MIKDSKIKLSKKKIYKSIVVLIIFLLICLLFVFYPDTFTSIIFRSKYLIFLIGISGIIFSILYLYPIINKLYKLNIGLEINENGIINNTEYLNLGLIKWSDVNNIRIKEFGKGRYLLLDLKNEEDYLNRLNSNVFKFYAKFNKVQYGTIVHITHSTLECTFEELEQFIIEGYDSSKNK